MKIDYAWRCGDFHRECEYEPHHARIIPLKPHIEPIAQHTATLLHAPCIKDPLQQFLFSISTSPAQAIAIIASVARHPELVGRGRPGDPVFYLPAVSIGLFYQEGEGYDSDNLQCAVREFRDGLLRTGIDRRIWIGSILKRPPTTYLPLQAQEVFAKWLYTYMLENEEVLDSIVAKVG